jgi:hypothetical protein
MMDEDRIREIVRQECEAIMAEAGLSDADIIVKKDKHWSEQESAANGVTMLKFVKRVGDIAIMIAKAGSKIVKIVVFALGLWQAAQFGSVLLFERNLPDTLQIARSVGDGLLEFHVADRSHTDVETPEKWVIISPSWKSLDQDGYVRMAHSVLSGEQSSEYLLTGDTEFVASSTTSISSIGSTSSSPDDFVV